MFGNGRVQLHAVGSLGKTIKYAMIRRPAASFFEQVGPWLNGLRMESIESHSQSESDGHLTLVIFYKELDAPPATDAEKQKAASEK